MNRNRLTLAISAAALVVLALPAIALGHTANGGCGTITLSNSQLQAIVVTHKTPTDWSAIVLGPVPGDATYPIAPGVYDVRWSDNVKHYGIEVTSCQRPTPTPTAAATPTPTPDPTPTPAPSATPTATPTATGTPTVTATPTSSILATTHRPQLTLPPTDTVTPAGRVDVDPLLVAIVFGLGFIALAVTLLSPNFRRRADR